MKKRIGTILVCMLLIASSLVIVSPIEALKVSGNTLYVGGSGLGNYTRIQDAIDNASDGDTVYVYNGIYYENLDVNKSLNLFGEDKNTTIIDGKSKNHVIRITYDNVTISGFTIRNSSGIENAGISIYSNYNTISENKITCNTEDGIIIQTSQDSYFKGCYNLITSNIICDNNRNGIFIASKRNNTISGNLITNNTYGIFLGCGYIWPENNTIYGNHILYNRKNGINMGYCRRNIIERNNINYNGIGIYIETEGLGSNVIKNNNFLGNLKDARFLFVLIPIYNTWLHNYWGVPKISPKIISGILLIPIGMIKLQWIFIPLPWIVFDIFPAKLPNYIPPLEVS